MKKLTTNELKAVTSIIVDKLTKVYDDERNRIISYIESLSYLKDFERDMNDLLKYYSVKKDLRVHSLGLKSAYKSHLIEKGSKRSEILQKFDEYNKYYFDSNRLFDFVKNQVTIRNTSVENIKNTDEFINKFIKEFLK